MLGPQADATTPARRRYIDWARGVAVLIMIEAHALDAWTRPADRSSTAFGYLMLVGGMAAPMFLWLAGLGLVLAAERGAPRAGSRWRAAEGVVRRGLEIFILAFLFRLQAFIVSPGSPVVTVFRVDILNIMGPAIAVAGLVWGASRSRWQVGFASALVATGIAMVTPIVRVAHWVGALPVWFQWYVRPTGDHTTFTLFPWAGFVFAGAACGAILASPASERDERRRVIALVIAGAALVAVGLYTASRPSIFRASSFWTSSPTYFAIRSGVVTLILGALFGLSPAAHRVPRVFDWIEVLGRNSLFIYWIHVELVYGYATWAVHRRLPLWGSILTYALFCTAMPWAVVGRDAFLRKWRSRRHGKPTASRTAAAPV